MEEHINHLNIIFKRFEKYGIIINPIKCAFGKSEVEFLGHRIFGTPTCVASIFSPTKTEAIIQFPVPANMKSF